MVGVILFHEVLIEAVVVGDGLQVLVGPVINVELRKLGVHAGFDLRLLGFDRRLDKHLRRFWEIHLLLRVEALKLSLDDAMLHATNHEGIEPFP